MCNILYKTNCELGWGAAWMPIVGNPHNHIDSVRLNWELELNWEPARYWALGGNLRSYCQLGVPHIYIMIFSNY